VRPHQLARRWPSIIVLTLLGVAIAAGALSIATPTYTAHADVLIVPPASKSTTAVADRTVASYSRVLTRETVGGSTGGQA